MPHDETKPVANAMRYGILNQVSSRELERAQLSLRAEICKHCANRTGGPRFDLDDPLAC